MLRALFEKDDVIFLTIFLLSFLFLQPEKTAKTVRAQTVTLSFRRISVGFPAIASSAAGRAGMLPDDQGLEVKSDPDTDIIIVIIEGFVGLFSMSSTGH